MSRHPSRPVFRSPRRRAAVCVSVALLALGGGLAYRLSGEKIAQIVASHATPLALRFQQGSVLRYSVEWSGTQRGRLFQGDGDESKSHATSAIDMAVDVDYFVESVSDDEAVLVMSIPDIHRHSIRLLGSDVFPTREAALGVLSGIHARVRIGTDGMPRDVRFEQGASDAFVNIAQWIVAQSALSLGDSKRAPEWDASERGPFGTSDVHYARIDDGLRRTRTKYTSFDAFSHDPSAVAVEKLDGSSSIHLRDGAIERVSTKETIRVDARAGGTELEGTSTFDLRLRAIDSVASAPVAFAVGVATPAGEPTVGQDTIQKLLDQRIDGLTREQLLGDMTRYGNSGVMPMHTKWLWRSTGLLKKDPSIAAELAKLALAPGATDKARALVLDVLASVGHAEAQKAMRTILTSRELAGSTSKPALLQRISLLDKPDRETIDAVLDALRDGKRRKSKDLILASAYTLAASAQSVEKEGDRPTARRIVREIENELRASDKPEMTVGLLGALGNASHADVAGIAKNYATNEDIDVREAAAGAVRKVETPEAIDVLVALLGDPNVHVQAAAIASLAAHALTPEHWERIAALAGSGRLAAALDGALLNLAASYLGRDPAVARVVAVIASRPDGNASVHARAVSMLERVAAG